MAPQLCVFFFQWCAAFLLWLLLQRYGIQLFVCVCVLIVTVHMVRMVRNFSRFNGCVRDILVSKIPASKFRGGEKLFV